MPVTKRDDGSLEVRPTRTRARAAMALFTLVPAVLFAAMWVFFFIYLRMWTMPADTWLVVLVGGILLNPLTWVSLGGLVTFNAFWNGTTLLYREDGYLVIKQLQWGRGISHRTDLSRLPRLSLEVVRYPRDETDPEWRTSFRPRVVGMDMGSRVIRVGEGLTVSEATVLAGALHEMTEAP